jgi:hypothetical protein
MVCIESLFGIREALVRRFGVILAERFRLRCSSLANGRY